VRCTRNGHGIHGHVANRIRYAERLLPLGRHARNSHVRRHTNTPQLYAIKNHT